MAQPKAPVMLTAIPQVQPKPMLEPKPLATTVQPQPQTAPKTEAPEARVDKPLVQAPLAEAPKAAVARPQPLQVATLPEVPRQEVARPRAESKVDTKSERDNSQISGVASTAASDRVRPQIEVLRRREDVQTPEFAAAGMESLAQFGQGQGGGQQQQQRRQQQEEESDEGAGDEDLSADRRAVDLRLEFDWLAAQDNLMAFSSELREATFGLRQRPATSICLEDFHPQEKRLVTPAQASGDKSSFSLEQRGRHGPA